VSGFLSNYKFKKIKNQELIVLLANRLKVAHVLQPSQEALWIMQKLLEQKWTLFGDTTLSQELICKIEEIVCLRVLQQKPLAYILGVTPFLDLDILCQEPILIPRPDTESWVEQLIDHLKKSGVSEKKFRVLDLCTGSGCIALAIAKAFSNSLVFGVDIDPRAIVLAKRNAEYNSIKNAVFFESDLFENVDVQEIDLIVSNPPYISQEQYQVLDVSVRDWESKIALVADNNGLFFYDRIVQKVFEIFSNKNKQHEDGMICLALEMDSLQVNYVDKLLREKNFSTQVVCDIFHRNRAIFAKM